MGETMNTYLTGYFVHTACVVLSGSFFLLRGIWMLQDSKWLQHGTVRVLPHIIDTFLLLSGISLMFQVQQFPFANNWLTMKLAALIAYIGLGMFALRRGRSKAHRALFLVGAVLTFAFMISVALTRHPAGVFA